MSPGPSESEATTCLIAGGGPAGIMLGLLLARAGVKVTVMEKHADFLRDFRGDTVHASTLRLLDELGLGARFAQLPHRLINTIHMEIQDEPVGLDLTRLPGAHQHIALVPQWDFLEMVATAAEAEPSFRLMRSTEVVGVIRDRNRGRDRIAGVTYRDQTGETKQMRAELTVACDGRSSTVRSAVGLTPHSFGAPMDVWWFRLPRRPDDPSGLAGVLRAGHATIVIDRGDYYQIAYIIPKGTDAQLRAQGIEALHRALVGMVPWLADRVDALTSFDDVKLLDVQLNRLRRWYADGVLFIGDAAHAMSPVGGVGINLAVADAVAAARILAGPSPASGRYPQRRLRVSTRQLARVQVRRWIPTVILQAAQRMIHAKVIAAAVAGKDQRAPRGVRLVGRHGGLAATGRLPGRDRPAARARAEVRQTPRVSPRATATSAKSWTTGRSTVDDDGMVLHANPPTSPPTPRPEEAFERPRQTEPSIASPIDFSAPAPLSSSGSLRNPFPPIADYAFLSDWETTCLISPAGSVEWMCVPRPDSPSVFGAILDRSAGHFRLGPYGVSVPSARRYLPGSLIMETTWQTHTGWLIVRDALVMGPWHDIERRSRTHRRTPMDWDAEHILLRTVRCVSGTVELMMSCEPAFDYHRVGATWEYSANAYGEAIARATKQPGRPPDAAADHQPADRARGPRSAGTHPDEGGRRRVRRAELDQAPGAADLRRGRRQDVADHRVLAAVDQHRQLPRPPVAGIPAAQRAHAEGVDVLAHRCAAGGQHHVAAGNAARRTQLGLPLRLGSRLHVRVCGGSTRWDWTARPTTSSRSSPTCPAPTTTSVIRCR